MKKIIERKITLSGKEFIYNCNLICREDRRGILKYEVKKHHKVGNLDIKPHTITYAFYNKDKPFILYKWFDVKGKLMGNYFNISDSLHLFEEEFRWRDLTVDVMVYPDFRIDILDEKEIPEEIDDNLISYIDSTKSHIVKNHREIIKRTDRFLNRYIR